MRAYCGRLSFDTRDGKRFPGMAPLQYTRTMFRRPGSDYWYTRVNGKRVSLRTTDKREAREREAAVHGVAYRKRVDPGYRAPHKTTLKKALARRIDDRTAKGRSPATIEMLLLHGRHLLRVLGDVSPLTEIDARACDAYVERRELEGAKRPTIAKELSTLRGTLKTAKRRGEFPGDISEVVPELSGASEPGTRALTYAEVLRLLAALPPPRRAMCAFIVATGADLGSCFAARRADVDLATWRVLVRGTKTKQRRRVVPVHVEYRRFVEDAIGYMPFDAWGNVRRDLEVACKRAGVPRVTPRDLRASCTTILRNEFQVRDLGALSRILGHADTRMVERRYGPLTLDGLEAIMGEDDKSTAGA
jgi:integrase